MLKKEKIKRTIQNSIDVSKSFETVDKPIAIVDPEPTVEEKDNVITLDPNGIDGFSVMRDCIICMEPKIALTGLHSDILICEDCRKVLKKLVEENR